MRKMPTSLFSFDFSWDLRGLSDAGTAGRHLSAKKLSGLQRINVRGLLDLARESVDRALKTP
jgi:hypothetical protein